MARWILLTAAASLSLVAGAAVAMLRGAAGETPKGGAAPAESDWLVSPPAEAAFGHARALDFLRADPKRAALLAAATRVSASVLRVRCAVINGDVTTTTNGTCVVVGRRCVLTARHVLKDEAGAQYSVLLADGTRVPATVFARGDAPGDPGDWALLEVAANAPPLPPAIPVREGREGTLVVGIGFGSSAGIASDGRGFDNDRGESGTPIWAVARDGSLDEPHVELVAGGLPKGGASGGPLVDAAGAVVRVSSGWTINRESMSLTDVPGRPQTKVSCRYAIDTASVAAVIAALAKRADVPR